MVNGYDIWSNLGRLVQLDPAAAEALVARYNTDCAGNQENLVVIKYSDFICLVY